MFIKACGRAVSFLKFGGVHSTRLIINHDACQIAVSNDFLKTIGGLSGWRRGYSSGTTSTGGQYTSSTPSPPLQDLKDIHGSSTSTNNDSSPHPSSLGYVYDKEGEEEYQIKLKILEASLKHVNILGWSSDALRAGAADLNFSESISAMCTPFDLVEYFQRFSNEQLETHLKGLDKKDKNLYSSLEYRLKLVVPYIDKYHQAMGLSLEPVNVPRSLQILRDLSDSICINGLGDKSTDLRWYTKRTGIVSVYVSTEFCMVQDKSDDFKETWEFLQRRVKDYDFVEGVGSTALPVLESSVITLLNILGMNRRR